MFWRVVVHQHKGKINESIYEWKQKNKRAHADGIKVLMIPTHPARVSQDTTDEGSKGHYRNPNDSERQKKTESKHCQLFRGTRTKLAD